MKEVLKLYILRLAIAWLRHSYTFDYRGNPQNNLLANTWESQTFLNCTLRVLELAQSM